MDGKMNTTIHGLTLNHAQKTLLEDFNNVEVFKSKENIVIHIKTFALQTIWITANENGIISKVQLVG
jgi:hypothetical protein